MSQRTSFLSTLAVVLFCLSLPSLTTAEPAPKKLKTKPYKVVPLSPEEALKAFKIPEGYRLEIAAAEPIVNEPVLCVWDGNGRMYVAEMSTYMQEIDGKNQHNPICQVVRIDDTDGDGRMDKRTVFVDKLCLPRMILPLQDGVVIRETNTLDLWYYRDNDGDNVADEKKLWHEGGGRGGNLEHQPSGLVWNIDNWIYTTYSNHRYRFTNGKVIREPMPMGSGQWGLGRDDVGKLYFSTAGGEQPAMDFQQNPIYGRIRLSGELAPGFKTVYPLDDVPDVQGGLGRVRSDGSLNHFTGCAGQSVYRGDRLPSDLYGDLIIPEPVGRLIRRAKIRNVNGKTVLENAYDKKEFIATADPNFRPLNSATGPDGCLYIVDMYRGIIQEGNWVRPGSYLRKVVQAYELDKVIGRGRIYRLVHKDHQPGPQPRLLDTKTEDLVPHLAHPNGWWRDNAQKLIILRGDKKVAPLLEKMARESQSWHGRLHALWTLEGLGAANMKLLSQAMLKDQHEHVRAAAVRISEPFLEKNIPQALQAIEKATEDSSPNVKIQTYLSLGHTQVQGFEALTKKIVASEESNSAITEIARLRENEMRRIVEEKKRREELRKKNEKLARLVEHGQVIYKTLCITCHGPDGKGTKSPDDPTKTIAPTLAGSPRVQGSKRRLIRILLHGLTGPVDDKTYTELMVPMGSNNDEWIAAVSNYIRINFGNKGSYIDPDDVATIREVSKGRRRPWTLAELHEYDPTLSNQKQWKAKASHNSGNVRNAFNGNLSNRWDTGKPQEPGMWFQLELPEPRKIQGIHLNTTGSNRDMPVGYEVRVSLDGKKWSEIIKKGLGGSKLITEIDFKPVKAKFLKITQTGTKPGLFWSIHDMKVFEAPHEKPKDLEDVPVYEELPPVEKLLTLKGNPSQGKMVFKRHCRLCHQIKGEGTVFGPDLTDVGKRLDKKALMDSILNPNAKITEGFKGVTLLTTKGQFISGFISKEKGKKLTIIQPGGTKQTLGTDEIIQRTEKAETFMPEDLKKQMTKQNFIDLVEYLGTLKISSPKR